MEVTPSRLTHTNDPNDRPVDRGPVRRNRCRVHDLHTLLGIPDLKPLTPFHAILSRSVFLARERAGLTQIELANRIQCDRMTIVRIEAGRYGLTLERAVRIARECNMTFTDMTFTDMFQDFDTLKDKS